MTLSVESLEHLSLHLGAMLTPICLVDTLYLLDFELRPTLLLLTSLTPVVVLKQVHVPKLLNLMDVKQTLLARAWVIRCLI